MAQDFDNQSSAPQRDVWRTVLSWLGIAAAALVIFAALYFALRLPPSVRGPAMTIIYLLPIVARGILWPPRSAGAASDEEIIAQERNAYVRSRRTARLFLVWFIAGLAIFLALDVTGSLSGLPRQIAMIAVMAWPLAMVALLFRPRAPREALSPRIVRRQIDEHHARYRWIWALMIVVLLQQANFESHQTEPTFGFLVLIALAAAIVTFGPGFIKAGYRKGLNDELTVALRGKSLVTGYLAAMA